MELEKIFNIKQTENGDIAFNKVSNNNPLLNILFLTEYYQHHLNEVKIGNSDIEKLFSMFIRDPRYGLGRRDLGRVLMRLSECSIEQIVKAGRVDDLFYTSINTAMQYNILSWLKNEIIKGNDLVKKWMPRYSSKNVLLARHIAKSWNMNKQQYGHFIKCNTVENQMSDKRFDDIEFEHIPSLAAIKYVKAFERHCSGRYNRYLADVKEGKAKLNITCTNVYDIYRNREKIDADLFFSKIEKISINCIPIVDTSGSMMSNDSIGKALAIGHYLSKCSSYCPNKVVTFSSQPQLITLGTPIVENRYSEFKHAISAYGREINSMYTGDCSNTDFGKVMELLSYLDGKMPQWLVVLSDMEFDAGSKTSKDATMNLFKEKGYTTRIIWWNLNSRNITCPEMDDEGNIFLSGYSPMLLKFLKVGFDGNEFLNTLLIEYSNAIK